MNEGIDIVQEAKTLPQRTRGRACIVLTHDYAGQKAWAAKLSALSGAQHIDLLDHFVLEQGLLKEIGKFTLVDLLALLGEMEGQKVLIVSGIEFLQATWAGRSNAMEQFAHQIEYWDKSPALLFVIQHDGFLASRRFTRHPQYRFVMDQKETFALS